MLQLEQIKKDNRSQQRDNEERCTDNGNPKRGNVRAYSMFLHGTRRSFGKDKHCNAFLSADET